MKEFDKDLQVKVENYLKTTSTTAGDLGKAIGFSGTAISQYRNSTYTGDVAKIEKRLRDYFSNIEESEKVSKTVGYVETSVSKSVYKTIRLCHAQGGLAIEAGDAGIGKTMAAKRYADDHPSAIFNWQLNTI